ncbi:Uncharacterised protein [Shigella sonnei]|nr:Uncharacterised protein [Shigella sonnei]
MMANRTRRTDKIGKRPFDIHHENLADVAFDPVVEYRHQKFTKFIGAHRPFRQFPLNITRRMQFQSIAGSCFISQTLDHRNKLDEFDSRIAQKIINLQRLLRAGAVDADQHVIVDMMFLQQRQGTHHQLMRWSATFGHAILIVDLSRTVQR